MQRFHIAYWALNAAPWRVFRTVEADSAREAIERAAPQAAGRYRVIVAGSDRTAGLFRLSLTGGRCELLEVTSFDRGESEPARENDLPSVTVGKVEELSRWPRPSGGTHPR